MPRQSRFGQWAGAAAAENGFSPAAALPAPPPLQEEPRKPQPEEPHWADPQDAFLDDPVVLQGAPVEPEKEDDDEEEDHVQGPLWFRVLIDRARVRKYPDSKASPVAWLERGEIVEAAEVLKGYANLARGEREERDISEDCGAWVLIDGISMNCGVLLEPYTPRWFEVTFEPRVAIRKSATQQAPPVEWMNKGEVFEVAAVRCGWVALSSRERAKRDISKDCGSWVLIDAKGLGTLIKICPPPNAPALVPAEEEE